MSNRMEEAREELEVFLEQKKQLEDLLAHPGWKLLCDEGMGMIRAMRSQEFRRRIRSLDDAFESGDHRAQMEGIGQILNHPQQMLDSIEATLDNLRTEIQELQRDADDNE